MTRRGPKRSLCVAQLLPAMHEGGVERGTLEVAAALAADGHEALVVSQGGRMVDALTNAGAEHIFMPVGRKSPVSLTLVPALRRLLISRRVDILHLRSRFPAWLGYLAWRGLPQAVRPRLVTTVHGLYSVNWYSAIMVRGERVIAVSNAVEKYLMENYPRLEPQRLQVIHRGVDDSRYHPGYRPSAEWTRAWCAAQPEMAGEILVTMAGRISRRKGLEDFIEVIARLQDRGVPARGMVVGDDTGRRRRYAATLKNQVARRNLPIHFAGSRNDLREIFSISDIVVSLSAQPESFGRTVLEALALGTPVVGYDHGGVGEILRAMFPRGAVPVANPAAAAAAIEDLQTNKVRTISPNAFPLRKMLEDTLLLYQQLVDA